jgi:hypothetical protein
MGTLNALYVCIKAPFQKETLLEIYPTAYTEASLTFYAIEQSPQSLESPEAQWIDQLIDLSAQLDTDVIWLSFQSLVEGFQFWHWKSGRSLRQLVYGCFTQEGIWERIEGEPEPWERNAFFALPQLEQGLPDYTPDVVQDLQQRWQAGEILPGDFEPCIDAREAARQVAKFYQLPGWDLV